MLWDTPIITIQSTRSFIHFQPSSSIMPIVNALHQSFDHDSPPRNAKFHSSLSVLLITVCCATLESPIYSALLLVTLFPKGKDDWARLAELFHTNRWWNIRYWNLQSPVRPGERFGPSAARIELRRLSPGPGYRWAYLVLVEMDMYGANMGLCSMEDRVNPFTDWAIVMDCGDISNSPFDKLDESRELRIMAIMSGWCRLGEIIQTVCYYISKFLFCGKTLKHDSPPNPPSPKLLLEQRSCHPTLRFSFGHMESQATQPRNDERLRAHARKHAPSNT